MQDKESRIKKAFLKFFMALTIAIIALLNPLTAKFLLNGGENFSPNVLLAILVFDALLGLWLLLIYMALRNVEHRATNLLVNSSMTMLISGMTFLILELFARWYSPAEPVQLYAYNEFFDCAWHKPNLDINLKTDEYDVSFRTNSIGLRGADELIPKGPNEIRIMNLGDSFIQAAQVDIENTMTSRLEKMFNSGESENQVRVFNVGTSGSDPGFQKDFLRKNIDKFELDYVFYFPYVGNDILTLNSVKKETQTKFESVQSSFVGIAKQHSKLVSYVYRMLGPGEAGMRGPMGRPSQPFDGQPSEQSANIFLRDENRFISSAFANLEKQLDGIMDLCDERGIRLFVFIVPTKEQVDSESLEETLDYFQIPKESIDLKKPQEKIENHLSGRNVYCFDLVDTLVNANSYRKTYFDFDSHWNSHGNTVVAEFIFNRTKKSVVDFQ